MEMKGHLIIVIGAGPAGLQVANILSKADHCVALLNRDVKFGGLAEYGIFPSKHRLRAGLRKNYWETLRRQNVSYFGNIKVGVQGPVSVRDLEQIGASALVFATGAQGTKSIGIEGEDALGVFHAKDLVYHFNQLPGFSQRPFEIGERVAVIGIGDVMVDIAHWLIRYRKVREVTAIVRRGPAERKYNPKEVRAICSNVDREDLEREFSRIGSRLQDAGQDPSRILKEMLEEFTKCVPAVSETKMKFRFLSSPVRVRADQQNRVRALELEENRLERRGDDFACIGLNQSQDLECDTVIFAVGDQVDQNLGLPTRNGNLATNPRHTRNDPDDALFQVYDERSGKVLDGIFTVGWARKASVGLVGIAKRDGDWCSEVILRYLKTREPSAHTALEEKVKNLRSLLEIRQPDVVTKEDIEVLSQVETEMARLRGLEEFKFSSNEEMLAAIRKRRCSATAVGAC